jgi:hypothetical protein
MRNCAIAAVVPTGFRSPAGSHQPRQQTLFEVPEKVSPVTQPLPTN